jgi:Ca-activated chloride channel family protein
MAAAPAAAAPAPSPLGKIVGRLADQDTRTGRDWAELARETVTWGQKIQSEQRPVPEGPVRDALAAVDLGAGLDAKTADWPQLRRELEALLQQPEPPPPQQKQEQREKQDQGKQDQKQQPQQDQQQSEQSQSDQQQEQQPQQSDAAQPEEKQDGKQDSAFGDMKEKAEPPPPPRDTQKVGGAPEKKEGEQEPTDPSLAMPLQKLDQVRNQDSPARLFQLMDGEKKPAPARQGKNW